MPVEHRGRVIQAGERTDVVIVSIVRAEVPAKPAHSDEERTVRRARLDRNDPR
jgi:hypothetical protein